MKIDTLKKKLGSYHHSYGSPDQFKKNLIGCVIFSIYLG